MVSTQVDPFSLDADQIQGLLQPSAPLLPELDAARDNLQALRAAPATALVLAQTRALLSDIADVPQTVYTEYRLFANTGDRDQYEFKYFRKRAKVAAAALLVFFGQPELKDALQDHIWSICEETDWVAPAHEGRPAIDLYAAETGYQLAEVLMLLGGTLNSEIRSRVRSEIERRIFAPYLRTFEAHDWYQRPQNWNSVCNSAIAATFMILEPEPARVARALEVALNGLSVYLASGFEEDGTSTEGVHCWRYGLTNFIAMVEMLRSQTGGAVDLLVLERMRPISAYPDKMRLSDARFASFPDSEERIEFNPGIIKRLSERTSDRSLLNLLTPAAEVASQELNGRDGIWRLPMALRNMLWWDGRTYDAAPVEDAELSAGGVGRITGKTQGGADMALIMKAGHNRENHNHNDVGSFILHIDGETFLTDPGRGLFNREYFRGGRYDNIFANSYGHSVPRIGGQLQGNDRDFRGQWLGVDHVDGPIPSKRLALEFADAYPDTGLKRLHREILLSQAPDQLGRLWLCDQFEFADEPEEVEEALVTWLDVDIDGATALLHGQRHNLRLAIEEPSGARFAANRLEKESRANGKSRVLTRLYSALPMGTSTEWRVRMRAEPRRQA